MNDELKQREQLSALSDGQLQGDEFAQAMAAAATPEGHATWAMYHLVGDVLRSPELVHHGRNNDLLSAVRARMAQEPLPKPQPAPLQQVARHGKAQAANVSVFRWKMVAGFASLAAVSAIGWNAAIGLRDEAAPGAQLAAAVPAQAPAPAAIPAPMVAVAADGDGTQPGAQVMLRDPRLDELVAAHRQYHGATNLQMPAGFLRNATFDTPKSAQR
ncbi:anti-anti-sigma factor [Acidovorax sp. YS12]|nr:anti-anti-sigma factor [Acidovorax sp. YS12]